MNEEKKTLGSWALEFNIRLLDLKYYDDEKLYTKEEYSNIVPRNIEVPLSSSSNKNEFTENELVKLENNEIIISDDWLTEYRKFKTIQLEMELKEKEFKLALKEAMETIGKPSIIRDGFSAVVKSSYSKTSLDSSRLKKELPDIYEEYSKTSNVASSIAITVE